MSAPATGHPGPYIRNSVIPEGVSVSEAARLLGVSRPALSNLLNGKATLSTNMAVRLEKAFGAVRSELMEMQRAYEESRSRNKGRCITVQNYAPAFLQIKAGDIEAWAGKNDAREALPAFLRRLINTTVNGLLKVDFSAFDEAQRPGWDGYLESSEATQWVPEGLSGWEFSCEVSLKKKADGDYAARIKSIPESERKNTVFIFVTPRNWPGKVKWQKEKSAQNKWKDVRAYDASDLEQWLEVSPAAQAWFAERIGLGAVGCCSLRDYWKKWARISKPHMSPFIFESEIENHFSYIENWLKGERSEPLIITAASKEEALAFLGAAAEIKKDFAADFDRFVVFESEDAVHRTRHSLDKVISATLSGAVERAVAENESGQRRIVAAERSFVMQKDGGIHIGLPTWESFEKACHDMGLEEGRADTLRRESGGSPTIMRRQLAASPGLRIPAWGKNRQNIKRMVPFVLAGHWIASQKADQDILSYLAQEDYSVIEQHIAELGAADDAPIWSEADYCGVTSVLEALHTVSSYITKDHLYRFFDIAEYVLTEDDPALDLEKNKRWAAHIYGKTRDHSPLIRRSVTDTLILLSIYGQEFFGGRLGFSVTGRIGNLIDRLLRNQPPRVWSARQNDLPAYAEAAPEAFLSVIEAELQKNDPAIAGLFEPAEAGIFSTNDRTGMLWALELLAWDPKMLARVILALAKLCRYELDDNWTNKPTNSIRDILLPWWPHTEAELEQRLEVTDALCSAAPNVGWNFCLDQIDTEHASTSGTHCPRWKRVNIQQGRAAPEADFWRASRHCLDTVLDWLEHNAETLSDLAKVFGLLPAEDRKKTAECIRHWLSQSPAVGDIAALRENIRKYNLTRWGRSREGDDSRDYVKEARVLYELLEPQDTLDRHLWLFADHWIDLDYNEEAGRDTDYRQEDARLDHARTAALREIYEQHGADGVRHLCAAGNTCHTIGRLFGRNVLGPETLLKFSSDCADRMLSDEDNFSGECLSGILRQFGKESLTDFMERLIAANNFDQSPEKLVRVLTSAPFWDVIWDMAESYGPEISEKYWKETKAGWEQFSPAAANRAARRLLKVGRSRAAFHTVKFSLKETGTGALIEILKSIPVQDEDSRSAPPLEHHYLTKALKILSSRTDAPRNELFRIEYFYIGAIGQGSGYKFPALSAEAAESPMLFFQFVALCYHRKDGKQDNNELPLPAPNKISEDAVPAAYRALKILSTMPGTGEGGSIDVQKLRDWTSEVRSLAKKHDREEITDIQLGEFFFRSKPVEDGVWPCAPVCTIIQEIASEDIAQGMYLAIRNSRGAHFRPRPDHGGPERELAKKYSDMAGPLLSAYPFVAEILLSVSRIYEHDAGREDSEARARKRIPF